MNKLLISVRDAEEARIVAAAGVDLVDIKEPALGSLGAADPSVWQEVVAEINGAVPVSVALGEFRELSRAFEQGSVGEGSVGEGFFAPGALDGIQFVKCGFAQCDDNLDIFRLWNDFVSGLPPHVSAVSVVYADWKNAAAPHPDEVLTQTQQAPVVLVDTYRKDGSHLFDALTARELVDIIQRCRSRGQMIVLGGSLRGDLITAALKLQADFVAVRGAVCGEDRSARIDAKLVGDLVKQIEQFNLDCINAEA
ncbi:MAG: hypothetical protein ACI9HK_001504 [Pirellulaceae bacterium]